MSYDWLIIEHYPEGTKWTHAFTSEANALDALAQLKAAHAGRKYELIHL